MRIVLHPLFRIGDAHQLQKPDSLFPGLVLRRVVVETHCLHDLLADGHRGIQGSHRILEHHGDTAAADLGLNEFRGTLDDIHRFDFLRLQVSLRDHPVVLVLDLGNALRTHVGIGIFDCSVVDRAVARQDAHHRFRGDGFSGTGLTHDGNGLALVQVQVHAAHRLDIASVGLEGDVQVADLQNGLCVSHDILLTSLSSSGRRHHAVRRPSC